jgi:hypothetical protein
MTISLAGEHYSAPAKSDVVHLKFANGADANETIRQSGADTITASIDASFNRERAAVTSHLKDAA